MYVTVRGLDYKGLGVKHLTRVRRSGGKDKILSSLKEVLVRSVVQYGTSEVEDILYTSSFKSR